MEQTAFKPRDDGKYDLPFGMVAEAGGRICYIRRVDMDYFCSLTKLTSNHHEVLYLNVAETLSKPMELSTTWQIFTEAQAMGFETLAFYPLIEAGMLVYRNDQGEMFPLMVAVHTSFIGVVLRGNPDGTLTVIREGIVGPEIQGESGPPLEGIENE
jgi:hypothetical protein